jgi:hypothetical protein
MTLNTTVLKLNLTQQVLRECFRARQSLLDDLIIYATDPVIVKRRYRMLKQLSLYEAQILNKIYNFESDNIEDFSMLNIKQELKHIVNRSS